MLMVPTEMAADEAECASEYISLSLSIIGLISCHPVDRNFTPMKRCSVSTPLAISLLIAYSPRAVCIQSPTIQGYDETIHNNTPTTINRTLEANS